MKYRVSVLRAFKKSNSIKQEEGSLIGENTSSMKLISSVGIIVAISILSKIMGFTRELLIADKFGANYQTDAFKASQTIAGLFFDIIGAAVITTFIPMLSESYIKNGKEDMYKFANTVINMLVIASFIIFGISYFFSPQIVKLIVPKFSGEAYAVTLRLTKLSMLNIIFMCISGGFIAILQTLEEFTAPALVGIMVSLPIIIYILSGARFGIVGLTMATIIGYGMQTIIQLPWLFKNKYIPKLRVNIKDKRIKKMLLLIAPIFIGIGFNQLNIIINNVMASGLQEGSISALSYANLVNGIIYSIFASAIVTVIYPKLSKEAKDTDFTEFKKHTNQAVTSISLIMIPTSFGLMILRSTIISILFKHGAFGGNAVNMTSNALLFYAIGMMVYGIRDVYNKAFYALQDTKTPILIGILGVGLNILCSVTLVPYIGIKALALGSSAADFACSILMVGFLSKKIGCRNEKRLVVNLAKILYASMVMSLCVFFTNSYFEARFTGFKGNLLNLFISVIIGVIVYTTSIWSLNIHEFNRVKELFLGKFKTLIIKKSSW